MTQSKSDSEETNAPTLVVSRARAEGVVNAAQDWLERFHHQAGSVLVSRLKHKIHELSLQMQGRSVDSIEKAIQGLLDVQDGFAALLGPPDTSDESKSTPRVHRPWVPRQSAQSVNENTTKHPSDAPVFISYAHADSQWLNRLLVHLRPLERSNRLHLWHDQKLRSGDKWRAEIDDVIRRASTAILIVSANFMASDFIYSNELPPIVRKADERGVTIFPLIVGHCLYDEDEQLSRFQAFNDPEKPLSRMEASVVDSTLVRLAKAIIGNRNG